MIRLSIVLVSAMLGAACTRQSEQISAKAFEVSATESEAPQPVIERPSAADLDQTRALMWQLAQQVRLLAFISDSPDQAASDARGHLQAMEEIVQRIAALPERRTHPLLDDNIGALLADIGRAKAEVAGESPEWGMTHSITTACVRCHELRTCPYDSYQRCVDVPVY